MNTLHKELLISAAVLVVAVAFFYAIGQRQAHEQLQNIPQTKMVQEHPAEAHHAFYSCADGQALSVTLYDTGVAHMTLLHADDTYSTLTLQKKVSDTGDFYMDTYNEHGLLIADNTATFSINHVVIADQCTYTLHTERHFPPDVSTDAQQPLSDRMDYMLYGDPALNRVVVMKLSTFEEVQSIPIDGDNVYCVDLVTDEKSYVMPRGSNFMQVLMRDATGAFVPGKKIDLPFHPRTGAKNRILNLELISGKDKAMYALVDITTDTLLATGGSDEVTDIVADYGGSNATGHAQWISANLFIFADRARHALTLYHVERLSETELAIEKRDTITTPLSVHTFFDKKKMLDGSYMLYATLEGHNDGEPGGIVELVVTDETLHMGRIAMASGGVHHAEAHPDQPVIYVPTGNGFVDIIDEKTMQTIKTVATGKGSGHVIWVRKYNIALILNHNDTFITVLDMSTHEKITDIEVAQDSPDYDTLLQSHSTRLSPDSKYYYGFATDSGTFFRVNLETMTKDKELYVGGTPKQASQPGELY